jgi:hypothetical protein
MEANILSPNLPLFFCEKCDITTNNKKDFKRHILTAKHKRLTTTNNLSTTKEYYCKCGKSYKHMSSLCKHRNNCKFKLIIPDNENKLTKDELIKQLITQNQQLIFENKEFKNFMFEQSNKMFEQNNKLIELASKPSSINNNSNNNNKQFNLNLFLNEKCKNAMNMSEFIDSIQIEDEDFENIGKLGYIQGISNIFIKGIKELDETMRPLHCNDIKRETLYIKDNNVWDKDENKQKIRNAIALIVHKNFKYIPIWQEANPLSFDVTTKKNDLYMRIANQVTTAITPDDDSGINKIIRNVANQVIIDKENTL